MLGQQMANILTISCNNLIGISLPLIAQLLPGDTKEIWESFDDFHLHHRDIPPKKETRLPEAYLSRERRHQRCGYITKQLFTKKCHKLKKHEKISFLYYIAAVVATFAACYFLHFASKRKN